MHPLKELVAHRDGVFLLQSFDHVDAGMINKAMLRCALHSLLRQLFKQSLCTICSAKTRIFSQKGGYA